MSRRAIVDEDLPRSIDETLKELGWQVIAVRDTELRGEPDDEIIRFAKTRKAILFSGDWGFANILRFSPKDYHGIVILGFPNEVSTHFMAKEVKKALKKISSRNFAKKLIIIEPGRIRIRR